MPTSARCETSPRFLNAGQMIVSPSPQSLAHLRRVLEKEQHHFAMPVQSFLSEYCKGDQS